MKKLIMFCLMLSFLVGCSSGKSNHTPQDGIAVYFSKNDNWAATVTLIRSEDSIFESLYIQDIGNPNETHSPIEYSLEGNGVNMESQYPQKLQGVRSFQVSSEFNQKLFKKEGLDKEYTLTIKSLGEASELKLQLIDGERDF